MKATYKLGTYPMTMNKVHLGGLLADPALAKVMREAGADKAKKKMATPAPISFCNHREKTSCCKLTVCYSIQNTLF
jgi:membrane carboxypeptidase/penicillin-binding protein